MMPQPSRMMAYAPSGSRVLDHVVGADVRDRADPNLFGHDLVSLHVRGRVGRAARLGSWRRGRSSREAPLASDRRESRHAGGGIRRGHSRLPRRHRAPARNPRMAAGVFRRAAGTVPPGGNGAGHDLRSAPAANRLALLRRPAGRLSRRGRRLRAAAGRRRRGLGARRGTPAVRRLRLSRPARAPGEPRRRRPGRRCGSPQRAHGRFRRRPRDVEGDETADGRAAVDARRADRLERLLPDRRGRRVSAADPGAPLHRLRRLDERPRVERRPRERPADARMVQGAALPVRAARRHPHHRAGRRRRRPGGAGGWQPPRDRRRAQPADDPVRAALRSAGGPNLRPPRRRRRPERRAHVHQPDRPAVRHRPARLRRFVRVGGLRRPVSVRELSLHD